MKHGDSTNQANKAFQASGPGQTCRSEEANRSGLLESIQDLKHSQPTSWPHGFSSVETVFDMVGRQWQTDPKSLSTQVPEEQRKSADQSG